LLTQIAVFFSFPPVFSQTTPIFRLSRMSPATDHWVDIYSLIVGRFWDKQAERVVVCCTFDQIIDIIITRGPNWPCLYLDRATNITYFGNTIQIYTWLIVSIYVYITAVMLRVGHKVQCFATNKLILLFGKINSSQCSWYIIWTM